MTTASRKQDAILDCALPFAATNRTLRIWRFYQQGYSQDEIAEFEGVSQMTVSRFILKAERIIASNLLQEQQGDVSLNITLKKGSEVVSMPDVTLRDALRNIARREKAKRVEDAPPLIDE